MKISKKMRKKLFLTKMFDIVNGKCLLMSRALKNILYLCVGRKGNEWQKIAYPVSDIAKEKSEANHAFTM